MCRPSKISEDWIVKGFHIHIDGIELAVHPDHQGGVTFKKVFASTTDAQEKLAVRRAEECLQDVEERRRWYRDVERARRYLCRDAGALTELALGRGAEFTFLLAALRRMGV